MSAAVAAAVAGGIISSVGGFLGGKKAASAAKEAQEMRNEAIQRQFEYDTELWEMNKEKIVADRDFIVYQTEKQAFNEGKLASFKDASNLQDYNYSMQIRNRQQDSLNKQWYRSDEVYNKQISLNAISARDAVEDEYRSLQEIHAEKSFEAQDNYIEQLQTEGQMRARGVGGRSMRKVGQVSYADLGRRMSLANEVLAGSGRETKSVLKEITRDYASADLSAFAQKMLDPGTLPVPVTPYATPMAEYIYPREIGEYDFGPAPVIGAIGSPSAAAGQVWGATISSIAGSIGSAVTAAGKGF